MVTRIARTTLTLLLVLSALLPAQVRGDAQELSEYDEYSLYMPLLADDRQPTDEIANAGLMPSANNEPVDEATTQVDELGEAVVDEGPVLSLVCTMQGWAAQEVRELTGRLQLDTQKGVGVIYPGALVQGGGFEDGNFTPITIARSDGTLTFHGLTFGEGVSPVSEVSEISDPNVTDAIHRKLGDNEIVGTTADFSYDVEEVHEMDHLLFTLGLDARFGSFSMGADLDIDTEEVKSYVLLKFTQIFYNVSFETPEYPTSVFRDGDSFYDRNNQIYPGNPPLYVSSVGYGRMVFLLAESDLQASTLEASLRAAYDNDLGTAISLDSGLTHTEVMSRTKLTYHVVGGAADLALEPLDSADPAEMYEAVRAFLSDPASAGFSAENPGAPIMYTLKYLHNNEVARMSYGITYDRRDCTNTMAYEHNSTVKRAGPVGGIGGGLFDDATLPETAARVTSVRVRHGMVIDSVQLIFDNADPDNVEDMECCKRHGGTGGAVESSFDLLRGEYITSIDGFFDDDPGLDTIPDWTILIRSLRIRTNTGRVSPLYGTTGGKEYRFEVPRGHEIAGFWGRSGSYVDALGVLIRKRYTLPEPDPRVYYLGPSGGDFNDDESLFVDWEDDEWNGQPYTNTVHVDEVLIGHGALIDGIQVVVDGNEGQLHGGHAGTTILTVDDQHYVSEVEGTYGGNVRGLKIRTTQNETGTGWLGGVGDEEFRYQVPEGYQIVGFWGLEGPYGDNSKNIRALGVQIGQLPPVE